MPKTLALVIYLCRLSLFRPANCTHHQDRKFCTTCPLLVEGNVCGLRNLYSWISISYQTILLSYPTIVSFAFSLCLQLFCSETSSYSYWNFQFKLLIQKKGFDTDHRAALSYLITIVKLFALILVFSHALAYPRP